MLGRCARRRSGALANEETNEEASGPQCDSGSQRGLLVFPFGRIPLCAAWRRPLAATQVRGKKALALSFKTSPACFDSQYCLQSSHNGLVCSQAAGEMLTCLIFAAKGLVVTNQ